MGTHRLYVRFPDGEIRHGLYYSVTDTAGVCLSDAAAEALLDWAMECDYTPDLDGTGEPVEVATSYADYFSWSATATREWLTSNRDWADSGVETTDGVPGWLAEYFDRESQFAPKRAVSRGRVFHLTSGAELKHRLMEATYGTPVSPTAFVPFDLATGETRAPTLSPEWAARILDQAPGVRDA